MTDTVREVAIMTEEWYPVYEVQEADRVNKRYGKVASVPERTLERWKIVTKLFEVIQEEIREYL